jgi:ribonucleoside-diphosphate reductase alpha chain
MYRHAWHAGLKTTYYLRTLGASSIEKTTVAVPAAVRVRELAAVGAGPLDALACSIEAMRNGEECEACQ